MEGFLCQNANLVVDIILEEFEVENLALTS
jgi:hypothetical protein